MPAQERGGQTGLVKPPTQRGRISRPHWRTGNANNAGGKGGILCGWGRRNDGLFVSSYQEDKELKRRRQTMEKLRRWLAAGALALVVVAAVASRSSSTATAEEAAPRLGGGGGGGDGSGTTVSAGTVNAPSPPPPPPPTPKPTPKPTSPPLPDEHTPNAACSYGSGGTKHKVKAIPDGSLCGRKIPVTLSNPASWSTPHTNMLSDFAKPGNGEVVLLGGGGPFGGVGSTLSAFFHAYDFAFEKKRPLYLTQNSWALNVLYELFLGPAAALEKDKELWAAIEKSLAVKIVEDEAALTAAGKTVPDRASSQGVFYHKPAAGVDASRLRDHRNTVLRMLFRYPAVLGAKNVCSAVDSVIKNEKEKKYAVVHFGPPGGDKWRAKLESSSGKNLLAAAEMRPDYVKSILRGTGMLGKEIYPIHGDSQNIDAEALSRLLADPELKGTLKGVDKEYSGCVGSNIYLAVLADVYIGNPAEGTALWVARMRYALGIKNTFVLTERRGDQWVSYLDDDSYLDLYDPTKLGVYMG